MICSFVCKVWICLAVWLLKMRSIYNWSLVLENCAVHYQIMKSRTESQEGAGINCEGCSDLWTAPLQTASLEKCSDQKELQQLFNITEKKMDRRAFHTLVGLFNVASCGDCAVGTLFMSTVSWHDRYGPLAGDLVHVFTQLKISLVVLQLMVCAPDGQGNSETLIQFVTLFLPLFESLFVWPHRAALGTFTSPGKWSKHFCPLCLFLSLALSFSLADRVTCRGHLPQTDTAGFTAMTLFPCYQYLSGTSHSAPQVFIIKGHPYSTCPLGIILTNHQLFHW